ncbi:MAG: ankyrin repeat domain-containing protein [Verrucomicrobiota bacterium]|nr:ankyrin repeat domain-containing protein [Verrucomicrobiota bacterium]MDP7048044.1 ankyrin repeat domain-containing protein [Verrucomicrobiota bacterium]
MKSLLLTTTLAVLLAGCATPEPAAILTPGTPIWAAAEAGNREVVRRHLVAGTDANTRDGQYGASSLHWAAWCGHSDIVELLIATKANVNAVNSDGETPLDCAENFSQNEIIALLRKHGGKTAAELRDEKSK